MITRAEIGKLIVLHAVEPTVLSLYLRVPRDPAEVRALPARSLQLMAAAATGPGGAGLLREEDRAAVRAGVAAHGGDWPGRTAAIFACADAGLFATYPLACDLPERAVLGTRPHVRPLLASLQRYPADVADRHAQRLAAEILRAAPAGLAAIGLAECLAAVNAHAVDLLVVPDDGLVPGFACGRCGALATAPDGCPDWGTAPQPVPDLIEEMVARTLEDDGEILAVRDAPFQVAARLRFR